MTQGAQQAVPHRSGPARMLRLRVPFLTLVAVLLLAVSASVVAGFIGIGYLDRALHEIAASDVQRVLYVTHVRRLFRSELVLVHELGKARDPEQRAVLEQRRLAVQEERADLLARLRVLGLPDQDQALRTLEEDHRASTQPGFWPSSRWETTVASTLAATEGRLARAAGEAARRGRTARMLLLAVSSTAVALALTLGGIVVRRARAASRMLSASEAQFRRVVESAPSLLAILSPARALTFLPPRGPGFLGVAPERLQSEPLCWVHPEDLPELAAHVEKALRPPAPSATVRVRARRDDGSTWHAAVSVTPLGDAPDMAGVVLQILDVSQQHQAEEARLALEEQLRQSQKMESIGRLAGGIAHDFNNLLTAIRGYASLAQINSSGAEAKPEYLDGIVTAAERATALTRQLLAFSRKHVIAPEPAALGELMARLETLLARLIGEDIQLEVRADPDLGRCLVDVNQAEQVILNLAVNARDAMPHGGTLLIEARNAELDEAYLARHPDAKAGRYVLLAVSDTGVGMSQEVQSRLFEPFFTTKPRGRGTGLGLSVVYGAVQQHGGTIDIVSSPGQGTTVRIYWPRIENEAVQDARPQGSKVSPRGTETVLVVEDDPLVRGFTADALSSHGYEVLAAANAAEALQIAAELSRGPGLLLTDVILPDRDGRQLAGELGSRWPGTPVLYCSGYSDRVMTRSGRLSPDVDYLPKPYDVATLVRRVRAAIDSCLAGTETSQAARPGR